MSNKIGFLPKKRSLPQTTTSFPLTRVKRIMKEDKDVIQISNESVFLVSLATVIFFFFKKKKFNSFISFFLILFYLLYIKEIIKYVTNLV